MKSEEKEVLPALSRLTSLNSDWSFCFFFKKKFFVWTRSKDKRVFRVILVEIFVKLCEIWFSWVLLIPFRSTFPLEAEEFYQLFYLQSIHCAIGCTLIFGISEVLYFRGRWLIWGLPGEGLLFKFCCCLRKMLEFCLYAVFFTSSL